MQYKVLFKRCLLAIVVMFVVTSLQAQREMKTINDNWEFRKSIDESWESVNLPHTFNIDAYQQRNYYQGKGFYRRTLVLSEIVAERRYYMKIDAASKAANIRVNGKEVGSHVGGYTACIVDITEYIRKENLIEITVDNGRKDITPISADFTFWGGIYRDVWLISTPKQHFNMSNMGSDGIFISTPVVNEKRGVLKVKCEVTNDSHESSILEVRSAIYSPQGKLLQTIKQKQKLKSGETYIFENTSGAIESPDLWSPETPSLYLVKTTLVDPKSGKLLDEKNHKVGFRWFTFDGSKGFFLNGKSYKLRGLNRHQDQAPAGVALDDEAHRRDIFLMKELGCNFIRISHFPQDDAILEMCDELGLLAWEEIPIINIVPNTPGYDDNCEYNLREMIRQHYNHSSVITWGYMNEILLTAPSIGKPEWLACKERTVNLAQRLEAVLKEEDPGRASVMAFNMTNLYNEIGLNLVDVVGWNLYHGWYVDKLKDFNAWCEDQHRRYPDQPMIISEWGAGSDKRLHSTQGRAFDFSIEYQQTYIEHYLPFIENTEWISGCAYWNFIDFNVAARQESMPRVNNKGLAYNNRIWKDVAYYFKAMWRKDIPVIRIASRDWEMRTGEINKPQSIKIYSNMPEVELFINGQSIGCQKIANCHTVFNVILPEGISVLMAQGIKNGKTVQDAMTIQFKSLPNIAEGDELAINVGSNCYFTSDISNLTWLPDQPYTAGGWGYIGGKAHSTTSEIYNTLDGPIYQTWREGNWSYKIDAPIGEYEIELLIADVTKPAAQLANLLNKNKEEKHSGETRFHISICGKQVETNFSPIDGGKHRTAFKRRYIIRNEHDHIVISAGAVKGEPFLAGIKVRKL
ncbi:glycoside hydrolase family 2 protein [Phocaeicola vulgatus]|uniref:glycoside hydrolase family 2 TIM barrel-domain containing protein n=1 Tax=Phocaeicola vulgatus TaxID=821 RepID=UPI00210C257E|nr:glycoside hydrolase family 2 TIM barrel-domain containing protein [Phocaeicola vulgatus]MCQ4909415.1 glycoside hydrolase family 2 protein [Phocaeicola vulgatus]MCQ4918316.1 glycoside hydrolase family 2 protein [Phocaeicola vulgatus]